MGRIYSCCFNAGAYNNASGDVDLFELTPADDKPLALHGLWLSNVGIAADAGDAQEELLQVNIVRGLTSSGSGGTTGSAVKMNNNDAANGFTYEYMNVTVATTGTAGTLHCDGWNVRIPYQMIWTPETRPVVTQADTTLVVRLSSTVTDDMLISATLLVEETA